MLTVTPTSGDIYYSEGKIYSNAYGSQEFIVTATPSVDDEGSYQAVSTTFTVTCPDNRTAVNLTDFSATNTTLIVGGSTATSATNDQVGWTAAYTYESSNTSIATVNASGVITAVAKGTATITCSLNVSTEDPTYKAGTTTSGSVEITVNKPSHTATFSVNGETSTQVLEEDAAVEFPEDPADINGMTFVGWYTDTYNHVSDAPVFVNKATATMGESDVTYYAVYADVEEVESDELEDCELDQTLQYDTWTYSGSTTNKSSYRLFHTDSYIESAAFDLSKLMKVIVYGGTFGGNEYNSLTIGDGTNTWKNVTVSGKSETGVNTYTEGTTLSGTKALRITCNSGSTSGTGSGVRISKIEIFVKGKEVSYSNFCTTISALPRPVITMANVEMTWGDTGKKVAPSATVEDEAVDGTFTFTSSDNTKLTVASDGTITCNVPGTYTVTATITATEDYQAASANCTVTVNKKDITLAFANAEVDKLTTDGSHTQNAIVTPAAYDGTIAYTLASNTCGASNSGSTVSFTTSGSVTVKANAPATDLYNAAEEVSYVLNVSKVPAATITALNISSVGAGTNGTLSATYTPAEDCDVTVTYTTSNALVLSIDGTSYEAESGGNVTVTVTVTPDDTDVYETVSREFDVTVTDTRTAPTFAFSASEVRANLDEKAQFEAPTLTNTSDGTLVFTSSDTDVATVNSTTGAVELLDVGTTTITAVVSGSATYQNAQASYTLTVYVPTYTFALVTDASSLRAGDKLIFVYEDANVAMGKNNGNNFGVTEITLNDGIATGVTNSPASFLTLEGTADAWYFNLNGQYLYAASSSSNQLKVKDEKDDNAKATISILAGDATITFQGTNTHNSLRYNSGSSLFSCYGSGSSLDEVLQIYRMSELVTLPAGIYATRCYDQALNYSSTDITVYTAKVNTEKSTVSLNEVNSGKVPANAGVILYSETGGTITVPVAESASALENNDLVGITEATLVKKTDDDTYYNYILQREVVNEVNKYAFNIATDEGAMLAANRAYLHTTFLASDNNARLAIVFGNNDDEPSGIEHLHSTSVQGAVFNLNGQRVENPKKGGLYIVNGKKMVVRQ